MMMGLDPMMGGLFDDMEEQMKIKRNLGMRKNEFISMKKLLSTILVLLLAMLPAAALAEELSPADQTANGLLAQYRAGEIAPGHLYEEAVELLELYMRAEKDSAPNPSILWELFDALPNYEFSMEYSLYAQIMVYLEEENYNEASSWLTVLGFYPEFGEMLKAEDYPYTSIRGLEEMELYVAARKDEKAGNQAAASEKYQRCLKFFDAMERFKGLRVDLDVIFNEARDQFKAGNYAKAMENAQYLLEYGYADQAAAQSLYDVASQQMQKAGHTPRPVDKPAKVTEAPAVTVTQAPATFRLSASPVNDYIRLNWDAPFAGASYTVYRRAGGSWRSVTTTKETYYFDNAVSGGNSYTYYVAAENNSRSATSAEVSVTAQYGNSGGNKPVTAAPVTPVLVTPKPQVWGSWSGWSTTPVSSSSTRQVETKVEEETTYVTKYKYNKWHYWTTKGVWYNSPVVLYNSSIYSDEKTAYWDYKTTDAPLSVAGTQTVNGKTYTYYKGYWWNETKVQEPAGTKTITYYRYRDLQ